MPSRAAALKICPPFTDDSAEEARERMPMDEAGFRAFYDCTARPLWAYLCRASGDPEGANDLLQETFCRLLSADLPVMDEEERRRYLFRIATNLLRDRWRSRKVEVPISDKLAGARKDFELHSDVRRAFQRLKLRERQLLWLAYVEGFNHDEIAQATSLRSNSIRLLLFRARQKLRNVLGVSRSKNAEMRADL
jgi:RNA polymerase sigma-70 factor (ECF subfamily)